jgi:hypothetical protein
MRHVVVKDSMKLINTWHRTDPRSKENGAAISTIVLVGLRVELLVGPLSSKLLAMWISVIFLPRMAWQHELKIFPGKFLPNKII